MKATSRVRWPEGVPDWEHHEVSDHYDPTTGNLHSTHLDHPVPLEEARSRRVNGEPLEYILRHCHVDEITVRCDERALIPRLETETLVRRILDRIDGFPAGPLIDCGTGTGFIAGWLDEMTERDVIATDRYSPPLELAYENRRINDWGFAILRMDRLRAIDSQAVAVIVANLPYVLPDSDKITRSVRTFEPTRSVRVPADPESFYRHFLDDALSVLRGSGELWMEGATPLFELLRSDVIPNFDCIEYEVISDTSGRARYLRVENTGMD